MKRSYILTLIAIGLFVGFWLGYFVFVQTHIKVICKPTNKVLVDAKRSLVPELLLKVDVAACESIDLVLEKVKPAELFTREKGTVTEPSSSWVGIVPEPPREEPSTQPTEPQNATKTEDLKIFDICSGKIEVSVQLIEGLEWCLNKEYPYNIILEKSPTSMKTNFYDGGFNETYSLSESFTVFRFFAQDVAIAGSSIQSIEMYGPLKDYFLIGNYTTDDVWMRNPQTGQSEIIKTVISVPLSVSQNIPTTDSWKNLNFYIKTASGNDFYIGTVWIYVISS